MRVRWQKLVFITTPPHLGKGHGPYNLNFKELFVATLVKISPIDLGKMIFNAGNLFSLLSYHLPLWGRAVHLNKEFTSHRMLFAKFGYTEYHSFFLYLGPWMAPERWYRPEPVGKGWDHSTATTFDQQSSLEPAELKPHEDPVKIGPEYLACRRGPLCMDVVWMRSRKPRFCVIADIHNKDPPPRCSKAVSTEHRPKLVAQPLPTMVTSPYKWNILERTDNRYTNN